MKEYEILQTNASGKIVLSAKWLKDNLGLEGDDSLLCVRLDNENVCMTKFNPMKDQDTQLKFIRSLKEGAKKEYENNRTTEYGRTEDGKILPQLAQHSPDGENI